MTILSSCLIFQAKSEEMAWQPCIILADMRQKDHASILESKKLPFSAYCLRVAGSECEEYGTHFLNKKGQRVRSPVDGL